MSCRTSPRSLPGVGIVSRPVDETVAGLTGFAESIGAAGDGGPDAPVLDQLITIEQTMRDDFVLDSDAPAGGLQRTLIDRFLRDTQRGNTEQFATAFVLLARSLGVNARVATGFVVDAPATSPLTLSSADAVIWPEIELTDGTWVAFDPVPVEETTDPAPQEPQSQVQTPAAPQPPIAAPPESADESSDTDDATTDVETDALSTVVLWATRAMAAVFVVLLPIIVGVGLVLGIKYRRRRRRRRAPQPTDRIRGAWASATDGLVDAGLDIPASFTDDEIARRGDPLAPNAHRELHRLAVLEQCRDVRCAAPSRPAGAGRTALSRGGRHGDRLDEEPLGTRQVAPEPALAAIDDPLSRCALSVQRTGYVALIVTVAVRDTSSPSSTWYVMV